MAFKVTASQLQSLHPSGAHALFELGGPDGLADALQTNLKSGLSIDANHSDRIATFSDNRLPDKKSKSFFRLLWEAYKDKILLMLTAAALISLAIGIYQYTRPEREPDWIEGVAIIVAIVIVVFVTALNDWQKERQFAKLNKMKEDRLVNVVRSGTTQRISTYDVLVGDLVLLEQGDILPVDGILLESHRLACDQSSMTGESDIIRKQPATTVYTALKQEKSLDKLDCFLISGAKVSEGIGRLLVTSTGINSTYGKTLMAVTEEAEVTPLQAKLIVIAKWIAAAGLTAAGLYFFILFVMFLYEITTDDWVNFDAARKGQIFLDIFVVSVSIIVVAVPEGLPLAVMLALAFATTRMLKDNNLVRLLRSCETMGNATTVCSDKTGTLTQNNMTTVAGCIWTLSSGLKTFRPVAQLQSDEKIGDDAQTFQAGLSEDDKRLLRQSLICNTTAHESKSTHDSAGSFIGSKTETALLSFATLYLGLQNLGIDRANEGELVWITPFDSAKKASAAVLRLPGTQTYRILLKGAPEIVADKYCSAMDDAKQRAINDTIVDFASQSWRTIGMAYKDIASWPIQGRDSDELGIDDVCHDMSWIGVFGLQDPLRPGVADAVADCKSAGVFVRMVTGDNEHTAKAIAQECGIFTGDGICLLGPKFRELSDDELDAILPRLQVLARSSPEDKRRLVKRLKALGETVAVTGDGTNDAPALKAADVGFSMGISGTEMAKEASAIILMDDNFSSIVKAMMWGRAVNDAVKRFLQFQLTVNITAVLTTVITGIESENQEVVLPAIQLLWVNLIMDTFAALALATDSPTRSILQRKPERKDASLITITMWKMIIGQAMYQLTAVLVLFFAKQHIFPRDWIEAHQDLTVLFNGYVWMQIFNTVNSRRLDNKLNVFEGILGNWIFVAVVAVMIGGQILIVFVGGRALEVVKLTAPQWGVSLLLGFISLPLGALLRCVPDRWVEAVALGILRVLEVPIGWMDKVSLKRFKRKDEEAIP